MKMTLTAKMALVALALTSGTATADQKKTTGQLAIDQFNRVRRQPFQRRI